MTNFKNTSIKIKNYKCFGEEPQGFDQIKPMNIVIGKNNAGKSTLLDLIEVSITHNPSTNVTKDLRQHSPNGKDPTIVVQMPLSETAIQAAFPRNTSGGPIHGDHYPFGLKWLEKPLTYEFSPGNPKVKSFVSLEPALNSIQGDVQWFNDKLVESIDFPFTGKLVKRLLADRDIKREGQDVSRDISSDGSQLTNTFRHYLNSAAMPSELIEENLRDELNKVVSPDMVFERISVQETEGIWELYLHEKGKGYIPLSSTGSGLKTLILALAFIHIVPHAEDRSLGDYVFCLEELENNLHPSVLRRLFIYLRRVAEEHRATFFITTHSNVVIDLFSKDEIAQIIHVKHDGILATARTVQTYVEHKHILDDLDIRASDLLQSNGIVWLEGPSDRLYFNRWIELLSDGQLREGVHYQCVFYGGRLLAHLSADDPDYNQDDLIKILRVNSNAIVLIDSDAREEGAALNATKRRIIDELTGVGGMAWVTHGKEVENYIPLKALRAFYGNDTLSKLGRNSTLPAYLAANLGPEEAKRFNRSKVLYAEQLAPFIDAEGMEQSDDLFEKVTEAMDHIRRWNSIDDTIS